MSSTTETQAPPGAAPAPPTGGAEDFLDAKAVAVRFGVSPRTVLRWARTGQIPAIGLGGERKTWTFYLPTLLEWAERTSRSSVR